jgi:2'-5' RNA ligase
MNSCSDVTSGFGPFPLKLQHVGYGPEPKRPKLLWVDCAATLEIAALRSALLQAYGRADERPFRPHITLARIRGSGSAFARNHPIDQPLSLTQLVQMIELFRSPPPGPSGYQILARAQLSAIAHPAKR